MSPRNRALEVGVIGVGNMGHHHARVYAELSEATLVGVYDADGDRARAVASEYDAAALNLETLLEAVDAVSIAVPTHAHYDVARRCLEAGVAPLIEKPVVCDLETGRKLRWTAADADVPVQVGHVERFNPAVETLEDLLEDLSVIGIAAERLGPPPEQPIDDSAVLDLMIHDVDVVCSLLEAEPTAVKSTGVQANRHASALLEFGSGSMASLTASRLTQRKVRTLEITAEECLLELDYIDQSIEIHRDSAPEYVERDGDVRFTHGSIVERPRVPADEPLRRELEAFLEAVRTGTTPAVTLEDGLRALEIAREIEKQGRSEPAEVEVVND
ncbi:Gfo/Idh/MocA family oxidoreductase [Natrialbaceae archaeon A-gly3]